MEKVTLKNTEKIITDPTVTTTEFESPDIKRTVKTSWRTKSDGTPNMEALKQYDSDVRNLQNAHHIDPNTGYVDKNKYLSDVFGINTEYNRRRREQEEKLNRYKQIESGILNSVNVMNDIAIAANGGNVWLREPNNVGKEASLRNIELNKEQSKEDALNGQRVAAQQKAYADAVNNLNAIYQKLYGGEYEETTHGNKKVEENKGYVKRTISKEEQEKIDPNKNTVIINGKRYAKTMNVSVKNPKTNKYIHFTVPTEDAMEYGRKYIAELASYVANYKGDKNNYVYKSIVGTLRDSRVIDSQGRLAPQMATDDDIYRILSKGDLYSLPNSDLISEMQRLYTLDKSKKGKKLVVKTSQYSNGYIPGAVETETKDLP